MSREKDMPPELPERLEAGTQNICGIAGLDASIRYIRRWGLDAIRQRESMLLDQLICALSDIDRLRLYLPDRAEHVGVLSIRCDGADCEELAAALGEEGVAVRAGLHCAPQAHETACTIDTETIRFSVSVFNTPEEMWRTAEILKNILKNRYKM